MQGGILVAQVKTISNHSGFFEFHLCGVDKCNGEISEQCFREGHCTQLQRDPNPACDDGNHKLCAPFDPEYPGRWHVPCSSLPPNTNYGREYFGGNTMIYITMFYNVISIYRGNTIPIRIGRPARENGTAMHPHLRLVAVYRYTL